MSTKKFQHTVASCDDAEGPVSPMGVTLRWVADSSSESVSSMAT